LKYRYYKNSERGFSLLEMVVAIAVMLVVTGAIFALMRDSVKTSTATLEMSDGQQSSRTGQEFINRDLMNAGDGLSNIIDIRVPQNFVANYLTLNPVDPSPSGIVNLGLLTSDNNLPPNTPVLGAAPTEEVRAAPLLTDRISILQTDRAFVPITLEAGDVDPATGRVSVERADIDDFRVGEIYFITSARGSIFATITDRLDVDTANPSLVFAAGDAFGLNSVGAGSELDFITSGATLPTSLSRMKIIHYYVNSNGLLMRRVFGVPNFGFFDSVIAEHVVSLQFRYFLNLRDVNDNVVQPVAQLTTSQEQVETRQVEVTLTVETPNTLQNGQRQQMSMTTSTSVRNMQFRQSLPPNAGG
jgi:prepilin-type N-terminal cleavage/methylation domain-containing protein